MIVNMEKVTLVGLTAEREIVIDRLQEAGVAHVIMSREAFEQPEAARNLQKVTETKKFLSKLTGHIVHGVSEADWSEVCRRRDELTQSENRIQGEITALKKERALMKVWGDFDWADLERLRAAGLHIYFYRVPNKAFDELDLSSIYHLIVHRSDAEAAFATISPYRPDFDLVEEKLPEKSLSQIDREIERRGVELDRIHRDFAELTVHIDRLELAEAQLTDQLEYKRVLDSIDRHLDDKVFVVKCWSPIPGDRLVEKLGSDVAVYQYREEPEEEDRIPVLLENGAAFEPGEDLVRIYSIPNDKDFDPSGLVLYWFALFFGMIVGDAGYGFILLALSFFLHLKIKEPGPLVKRLIRMLFLLSGAVLFFGVISASYFNVSLGEGNVLNKIRIFNFSTPEGQSFVMLVSILIGMAHITLSVAIQGYRQKDFSQYGWIIVIWAGYALINSKMGKGEDNPIAMWIMIAGLAVVFVFSSKSKNIGLRIAAGVNGLLGIIQIFSDVLSYLRLFALSVATVYMSQTFNMLAGDLNESIPFVGWIFAALVLILGHFINLVLAIMGGVIHGLRLNFLEWYRWCFEGDGLPYRPFTKISK